MKAIILKTRVRHAAGIFFIIAACGGALPASATILGNNASVTGTLSVSGLLTATGGLTVSGALSLPAGSIDLGGAAVTGHLPLSKITAGSNGQVLTVSGGVPTWQNASSGFTDPMSTAGDLIYRDGTNATTRLGTGSNGQVLTISGGLPTWQNSAAGFSDPMTTRGDLIFRNSSNSTVRLGRGAAGQMLKSDGTDISWQTPTKSDIGLGNVENTALSTFGGSSNIATLGTVTTGLWRGTRIDVSNGGTGLNGYSSGDLLVGSATGSLARLATGSNGQVLTVSGGVASWQTPAAGFSDPMTTRGDLIFRNASNATVRLGRGAAGQMLKSDGTDISWQTPTKSDVGLGNVENTALSTFGGSSNIATLGTVTTGLWRGTRIDVSNGGTGLNGYSSGDLLVGSATGSLSRLATGSNGQVLTVSGGVASWQTPTKSDVGLGNVENTALTTWGGSSTIVTVGTLSSGSTGAGFTLNLGSSTISGRLSASNGGTGLSGANSGDLLVGSATSSIARLTPGSNGQVLTISGGVPTWQTPAAGFSDPMTTRGDLIFRDAANSTARLGRGTANQVLRSDGTDLSWQTLAKSDVGLGNVENTALTTWGGSSSLTTLGTVTTGLWRGTRIDVSNGGTGLNGYSSGDVLVGSATGSLSRVAVGTNGQVLTISGGVPTWQTPAAGFSDPMTTRGDLIFRDASNATVRLGRGTAGQMLKSDGTDISWQTPTKSDVGLGNVENTALSTFSGSSSLTTLGTVTTGLWRGTRIDVSNGGTGLNGYSSGDLLVGSATGSLSRLATGSNGQVLTVSGGVASWQTPAAGFSDPMTTAGDMIIRNGSNATARLAAGSANQVLTISGGVPTWQDPGSSSFVDPMTTRGDIISRNASNATARLGRGGSGQVLMSDGLDIAWQSIDKTNVGLSNVENTALSTWLGSANISTLGTITTGTWHGAAISEAYGGTGRTDSPSAGQLLIGLNDGTYALATITAGSGIDVVNGDGSITIAADPTVSAQSTPSDPSTTASTSGVMMGLSGSITPTKSGKVMIIISGDMDNDTLSDGAQVQIRTGSGSAPANGAALTGTAQGGLVKLTNDTNGAPGRHPFSVNAIVSGLTLNSAAWIDVSLGAINGGNARIRDVSITATEL